MNPEDVKALIDQLMKTGEFLATNVYRIALRQNYAYAAVDLLFMLVSAVVGSALWKFHKKTWDDSENNWEYQKLESILAVVFSILLWAFAVSELGFAIMRLISPEWHAINDLINMIK